MSDIEQHPAVTAALAQLREALGSAGKRDEMVAEVQADLQAQTDHLQAEGLCEDEAVKQALETLGNPYELAHHIQAVAAPKPGKALTILRMIGGVGVVLWSLLFVWALRPGAYGLSGIAVTLGVLMFHLPVILVIWPGIIWRRNWLFGLLPTIIGLLLLVGMSVGGVSTQSEITLQVDASGQLVAGEIPESMKAFDWLPVIRVGMFISFGATCLILFFMMQQRAQRRRLLGILVLVLLLAELPFQLEEWRFRSIRDQVQAKLVDSANQPLSMERIAAAGLAEPESRLRCRPNPGGDGFIICWSRPISSGYAICYKSSDKSIWVND